MTEVSAGPPARASLRRVRLGVSDLDRSARFYRDVLGLTEADVDLVAAGRPGDRREWVNDDLQGGIRHLGLKVRDVDREVARLRAHGVRVISPPRDVIGGVRIAFFLDPDGIRLEFVQGDRRYEGAGCQSGPMDPVAAAGDRPRFDHVATTVADLPAAMRFWRDGLGFDVLGQIRHRDDPRGFLMTYLRAGPAVLEVFSFDVPTAPNPVPPEPGPRIGFLGVELTTAVSGPTRTLLDPDGVVVRIGSGP